MQVLPFVDEMGEYDRKMVMFSIKLHHFCAKPVEFLEWWVDVFIASSSGEAKVREVDEIGAFCRSKVVAEKKKPRIEEDARLSFGDCKTPFFRNEP